MKFEAQVRTEDINRYIEYGLDELQIKLKEIESEFKKKDFSKSYEKAVIEHAIKELKGA